MLRYADYSILFCYTADEVFWVCPNHFVSGMIRIMCKLIYEHTKSPAIIERPRQSISLTEGYEPWPFLIEEGVKLCAGCPPSRFLKNSTMKTRFWQGFWTLFLVMLMLKNMPAQGSLVDTVLVDRDSFLESFDPYLSVKLSVNNNLELLVYVLQP